MIQDFKNLLKGIYLFSNLNEAEIEKISAICRRESFPQGKLIFAEGNPGDKLY
jgi:signal-transduction protein with cAMP-binding, CBS, and nucleotidyltransferase domain